MKHIVLLLFLTFLTFGLLACNNSHENKKYNDLLPRENKAYSIYAVGKDVSMESLNKRGISNLEIEAIFFAPSLKFVHKQYPSLGFSSSPAFAVFNKNGLVFKTYSYFDMIKFLKQHEFKYAP